jgi:AcrR family transcriptional regulator
MESTVAECILYAATVEFARTGLAGARMARIARQAGVSTASLHYHFKTKRGLYDAVLERAAKTLRAEIAGVAGESRSGRDWLEVLADIGARHPTVARLLMHDLLLTGARRRGRPSLRDALRETATTLHASPFFRLHGTTERAIVMIEVIIAAWLLAGAVSGRAGRIYADRRSSSG